MNAPAHSPYVDSALYDLVYSWYTADLEFYVERARAARGPVLEAACGTGRVLIPTLEAGVDIDGFDLEPAMIERLRSKAAARGLAPRLFVGDLREFTAPRRYALITIPFRAFMHLETSDDQIAALRCLREHLAPGGALVLNLFYPRWEYMREHEGRRLLEREFTDPASGSHVALWDTAHYDRVNQRLVNEREVVVRDGDRETTHRYGFTLRWTFVYEMELLLGLAGFTRHALARGWDGGPFAHDTEEMVWTAWKD
jgi:SAM-dependent methyltransferase